MQLSRVKVGGRSEMERCARERHTSARGAERSCEAREAGEGDRSSMSSPEVAEPIRCTVGRRHEGSVSAEPWNTGVTVFVFNASGAGDLP